MLLVDRVAGVMMMAAGAVLVFLTGTLLGLALYLLWAAR